MPLKSVFHNPIVRPLVIWAVVITVVAVTGAVAWKYLTNYTRATAAHPSPIPGYLRLPENFTNEDLFVTYKGLRDEREFQMYFEMLDPQEARRALVEVTNILNENRSKEQLLEAINGALKDVRAFSEAFYYLEYDEAFLDDPQAFPELDHILNTYLIKEFELTVLGAFYKATHDPQFRFEWNNIHMLSARKLLGVLNELSER